MILLPGLLLPFAGTIAGAAAVFLLRGGNAATSAAATDAAATSDAVTDAAATDSATTDAAVTDAAVTDDAAASNTATDVTATDNAGRKRSVQPSWPGRLMTGFAAGVMTAASVWSLLLPSIGMSHEGPLPDWLPAAAGFAAGMLFLLLLDNAVPHLHACSDRPEGPAVPAARLGRTAKLNLAVTLHNIPEGMAVGVVLAGAVGGQADISPPAALALSLGIAVQNIPEGAIVSVPMLAAGNSRRRSFGYGVLSGAVEPAAGALTVLLIEHLLPWLPWLLSYAAGAMMYVVVDELIPEGRPGRHSDLSTIGFAVGFLLMMILDVATG